MRVIVGVRVRVVVEGDSVGEVRVRVRVIVKGEGDSGG